MAASGIDVQASAMNTQATPTLKRNRMGRKRSGHLRSCEKSCRDGKRTCEHSVNRQQDVLRQQCALDAIRAD
jgi:hypothetical protein